MKETLEINRLDSSLKQPLAILVSSNNIKNIPTEIKNNDFLKKTYQEMLSESEINSDIGCITYLFNPDSHFYKIYLIGIGNSDDVEQENYRKSAANLCRELRKKGINKVCLDFNFNEKTSEKDKSMFSQAFMEGFILRNYDFSKYCQNKYEKTVNQISIYKTDENIDKAINTGFILSNATNLNRDIANEPANIMNPPKMAEVCQEIASKNDKLNCKVFNEESLKEFKMGCFLGVAKASSSPPRMIVLEYFNGGDSETICLVGKGVTFDSGGISIKTSPNMFHMKKDMCGAAAVIGTMKAIAELDLKINVVGLVGATENMPDTNAFKPGDILTSMSGKTVEIINTDAEGRLVLADILTYCQKEYKPNYIIDIATLTGSVERALGGAISGAFTNNKPFLNKIIIASEKSNEHIWELPLGEKIYKGANKSYFADIKNASRKPPGGTKAALFLYEFVQSNIPWVHLDIAGTDTASGEPSSYYPRGATGVGTRTLSEFLINFAER